MEAGLDDYLMGTESHAFRCAEFVAFWASTEAIGLAGFAEGPIGELGVASLNCIYKPYGGVRQVVHLNLQTSKEKGLQSSASKTLLFKK